jgi:RNA polymerase-binding transcription factor DksA
MIKEKIKQRLEYLRKEIQKECISCEEIIELQSLSKYIDKGDILLLEWANIYEMEKCNHTEQLEQNIDIHTEKTEQKEYIVCSLCGETLRETN